MMSSAEAEDAWCPPTFSPSRFGRTWLAWWIIHVDSQRTFWRSAWRQASVSGVMVLLEYFDGRNLDLTLSRRPSRPPAAPGRRASTEAAEDRHGRDLVLRQVVPANPRRFPERRPRADHARRRDDDVDRHVVGRHRNVALDDLKLVHGGQ